MRHWIFMWVAVVTVGCSTAPVDDAGDTLASHDDTATSQSGCGHQVDPDGVNFGFNIVVDSSGATQSAQGRPLPQRHREVLHVTGRSLLRVPAQPHHNIP